MNAVSRFSAMCILFAAAAGITWADDQPAGMDAVPEAFREPALELGGIVAAIARGDLDAARDQYADRLRERPAAPQTPFETDFKESFRQAFERFPGPIDRLELMALQRFGSRSTNLVYIANSGVGPVVLWAQVYYFGDDWYLGSITFHLINGIDAQKMRLPPTDLFPLQHLAKPVSMALPTSERSAQSLTK